MSPQVLDLKKYAHIVFDCDGVVLNSNKVKTQAFYEAALPYGETAANQLVAYHVKNGGVSRYKKFSFFLEHIVRSELLASKLEQLLSRYATSVYEGLLTCEIASGLKVLREKTAHAQWSIVSGGDQEELRSIFAARKIDSYFDAGIFGSPATKDEIFGREISGGKFKLPAVFLGDSKYDFESSSRAGFDFIFVRGWSEIESPDDWIKANNLKVVDRISDI
ncbi:MAG: HAD hydrolase-like protein [Gammaproteobacteria bacterium]|nr:HAD hydrolase-like protein [Gammaproteobacteria bacterium]MBU2064342.1 HAD hydrolase-like protein [Gammaproteobacteria bacterium]MBU2179382.1 HAD hydrolase-like protein [Gammaproteobacteria bacterium]MBU2255562.1 HAD hydrolase-like protein [Gammaproteobacteria bacterium]